MFGKDKNGKLLIDNISEMKVVSYMKGLRSKGWSYFRSGFSIDILYRYFFFKPKVS